MLAGFAVFDDSHFVRVKLWVPYSGGSSVGPMKVILVSIRATFGMGGAINSRFGRRVILHATHGTALQVV